MAGLVLFGGLLSEAAPIDVRSDDVVITFDGPCFELSELDITHHGCYLYRESGFQFATGTIGAFINDAMNMSDDDDPHMTLEQLSGPPMDLLEFDVRISGPVGAFTLNGVLIDYDLLLAAGNHVVLPAGAGSTFQFELTSAQRVSFDNFHFRPVQVPEPALLAIFAVGLLFVGRRLS